MKKLLSLLAISATVLSSSVTTISCDQVKKLSFNKDELQKELKDDVHADVDIYQVLYQLIAKMAGNGVTIADIQKDTKIRIQVWEDNNKLNPGDRVSVGGHIRIDLEVLPGDEYFQQVNRYTIDLGTLSKITLTKDNINIKTQIAIYGAKYSDVYNNFRVQIANLAGISSATIATGSEMNNVLISLIINGNAVTSSDTTVKYGDSVSMKIKVEAVSKYYEKTADWMESNTIQIKAQLSKDVINLAGIEIDKKTYDDAYNMARQDIANVAGVTSDVIKTGSEKDKVLISLIVNGNAVTDSTTEIQYGDVISVKFEVKDSKYYMDTNGWLESSSIDKKATISQNDINIDASKITANQTTYTAEYNAFRTQIAQITGIDPSVIATGSEKDNVLISLIVNGNAVTSSDMVFKYGDSVSMKIMVSQNSRYYNATKNWMESNTIHLKAQLSKDTVNLTGITINTTTYGDVYNMARENIAAVAGITSDVIKTGSEKDNVLISLIVNGNAVTSSDTTVKYGDVVSVKFETTANSRYYMNTNGWLESDSFNQKVTISNLSVASEKIGTTYGSLYNKARTDIANLAGISADTIKTGSEADKVFVSIFVNGQWVGEDSTDTIKANDKIEEKVMVLDTSKYFNAMGWTVFNTHFPKVTITDDTPITVNTGTIVDNVLYSVVDTQIAQLAGIDPYLIQYGSESKSVYVRLYLDGDPVPTDFDKSVTLTTESKLKVSIQVNSNSQYYVETSKPIEINITING